jgi:acyl-CoA synthetase
MEGTARELSRPKATAEDVAVILFTSGTTKGSRGVLLTHNNIISSELIFSRGLGLDCTDIIFMPAPLSHATGFHHGIISTMLYGGKIVLLDRYDARVSMEMMEREQCTFSMGATPFVYDYIKLMDEGVKKPSAMRFYICGGAPVPYELTRKAWMAHQLMVCECYGSTESVPHVFVPPEEALALEGKWSGKVFDDIQVRIVDEHGRDVAPGEVGEEISRGPNVFVGYLGSREETDLALDDEGWYHSGDLCYGDDQGHIKICGRKKDIIVRGGENLNINEMEANLHGCPGLEKVAIVGMKDIRLGERVCAFVVPTDPDHPVTKEQISGYLKNKKVSKWLWPERIEYIDELPYTDSGKIKRYVLKEELERRQKEEKL